MPKPTPEVLAARYAHAVRKWHRAQVAAHRAQVAMQAAAVAAVPPFVTDQASRARYADFVDDQCRNCGMGPEHDTLAELVPHLYAYWNKELAD